MSEPQESNKGLAYDFGVTIAKGTVAGLAATVAGVTALTVAVSNLVQNSIEMDEFLNRSMISMGGYANSMKALAFIQEQIANGKSAFDPTDVMSGMKALQRAGMDARKNFDLIYQAANATGSSFAEMAEIVRSGNFNALAEVGLITDRTAYSMAQFNTNAQMASQSVLQLLKNSNSRGMFDETIQTLPMIWKRIGSFKRDFIMAILGDPKDPNGLANTVKARLNELANWLNRNRDRIIYIGKKIGMALSFFVNVVSDFMKRVFRSLGLMSAAQKKTQAEMKDGLMSFGLYLGILRAKINSFFDKYGSLIKKLLEIYLVTRAFKLLYPAIRTTMMLFNSKTWWNWIDITKSGLQNLRLRYWYLQDAAAKHMAYLKGPWKEGWKNLFGYIGGGFKKVFGPIGRLFTSSFSGITGVRSLFSGLWTFLRVGFVSVIRVISTAIFSIPIVGWIAAIITALVAAFAYLWNTSNKFKAFFINIWRTISNWFKLQALNILWLWRKITGGIAKAWHKVTSFISNVWNSVVDFVKDKLRPVYDFFVWIGDGIKSIWDGVVNYLSDIWSSFTDWIKGVWTDILDFFGVGVKNAADTTADLVNKRAKELGVDVKGEVGITAAELDAKDALDKKRKAEEEARANAVVPEYKDSPTGVYDYSPSGGASAASPKTTNVHSGAVQIHVYNANIDETKLAKIVQKRLETIDQNNKAAKGVVSEYN